MRKINKEQNKLKHILDRMVEINDSKDICDYKKELRKGK